MTFLVYPSDTQRRREKVTAFFCSTALFLIAPLLASAERLSLPTDFNPVLGFEFRVLNPSLAETPKFKIQNSKPSPSSSLQLVCPSDLTIGLPDNSCSATVQFPLPQAISTGCGGQPNILINSIFGIGNGPFVNVAAGVYKIDCRATNACGDTATCSFKITVRDTKKPMLALKSGLKGNITPDGTLRVFARQFNQNSSDNCTSATALRFSFSQNQADSVRIFNCSQLGKTNLQILVFDAAGNKSSGIATVDIMDGMGYCTATQIFGKIKTESGKSVDEVKMKLVSQNFEENQMTDATGFFNFENLEVGKNYSLQPTKNDNPMNGVNAFDLKLLNDHILGKKLLDSPHKIIAADVNHSGKVTTADVIELRRLILGEIPNFQQNTSWRFVPAGQVFPNPMDPFAADFLEEIELSGLAYGLPQQDFIGIKTGDLNGSAITGLAPTGDRAIQPNSNFYSNFYSNFLIEIENRPFKSGEIIEVAVRLADATFLPDAFQFTLNIDMAQLEFVSARPGTLSGMGFENIGQSRALEDGLLALAWNRPDQSEPRAGDAIIHTKFKAHKDGLLSDALRTSEQLTDLAAFDKEGKMHAVELKYRTETRAIGGVELEQNAPNPFIEMTLLKFFLPSATDATISIFDLSGRLVFERTSTYSAGNQQFLLNRSDIGQAGIFTYQVKTDYGLASRKLVMF